MPCLERTVQRSGIMIDEIHYYADVLRLWIQAKDPRDPSQRRKFTIRRDPRDISNIYFYDPESERYFRVSYRDTSRPAISIWELQEIRRRLKEEGRRSVDEDLIFDAYTRMRAIEAQSQRLTKTSRRAEQRRRMHRTADQPDLPETAESPKLKANDLVPPEEIRPFDEIEIFHG